MATAGSVTRVSLDHDHHQGRQRAVEDAPRPSSEGNEWTTVYTAFDEGVGANASDCLFQPILLESSQAFSVENAHTNQSEAPTPHLLGATPSLYCESAYPSNENSGLCEKVVEDKTGDFEWGKQQKGLVCGGALSSTEANAHVQQPKTPHHRDTAGVVDSDRGLGGLLLQRWRENSRRNAQAPNVQYHAASSSADLMVLSH